MKAAEHLIPAYLNDEASAAEVERLFVWVREKPEHAAEFARACSLHAHLRGHIHGQRELHGEPRPVIAQPSGLTEGAERAASTPTVWEQRINKVNRFLVAAALLLVLQASWGALTLLELCRRPAGVAAGRTPWEHNSNRNSPVEEFSDL